MACHLAGVHDRGRHLRHGVRRRARRGDPPAADGHRPFTGEVIFTFDGDAAGMKAAERAFGDDQKFMAQTFVAIEPTGMDPCELRQKSGDTAVLDLVARRIPLVEFVLRVDRRAGSTSTPPRDARAALDRGVPLVAQIKDHGAARRVRPPAGRAGRHRRPAAGRAAGARARALGQPAPRRRPRARAAPRRSTRPSSPSSARCSRSRCSCRPSPARSSTRSTPEAFLVAGAPRAAQRRSPTAGGTAAAVAGPAWTADDRGSTCPKSCASRRARAGGRAVAHRAPTAQDRYARRGARAHARDRRRAAGRGAEVEAAADEPAWSSPRSTPGCSAS